MIDSFPLSTWVLLSLYFTIFLVDLLADLLNLRAMAPEIPASFRDVFDSDKYARMQSYQSASTRFGIVHGTVGLAAFIVFWLAGGFAILDEGARSLGWGGVATGLVFIGALSALRGLLDLPFSIYHTFVIEERFGFNRTTWKTFVSDRIKGLVLGTLIGAPILALILVFFEKAGTSAWLFAWAAVTAIQLLLVFIASVWIMPLFNRYEPLPEGELKTAIEALARRQNFQLNGIFWMDSSKRSSKSNAFFTGFGRYKRLVLFDTLIERASVPELVSIVAHEIGHYKLRHIQRGIALSFGVTAAVFWAIGATLGDSTLQKGLLATFGISAPSIYASLVALSLALSPLGKLWSLFTLQRSRAHEFEADAYAREVCGRAEDLIEGLRKLSRDNLSNLTPHPLKVVLDYTHPPVMKRIERLARTR